MVKFLLSVYTVTKAKQ